jgi:outer membrane protein insertion porin family
MLQLFTLLRHAWPLLVALCCSVPVVAQDVARPAPVEDLPDLGESPRVERITFDGAEELPDDELTLRIVTQQTRCRSFLLRPFCALTDWRVITHREFLDREKLAADEVRLRVHYYQRGFRAADVRTELVPRGDGVEVVFLIEEGPPTLVESVEVEQAEPIFSRRQVRRAGLPREGERLDLIRLSEGLAYLVDGLGRRGWLDGAAHDTLDLSPDGLRARLRVVVDPGARSTLAGLDVEGNEDVSDRTVADALRLRTGRVLRTDDLVASQRSLYESNLFHEARVRVAPQQDSAKRVTITVREAAPRTARVGGGVNTTEFVQFDARFTHYNFKGRGRRLDVRGTVGNLLAEQLNGKGIFQDAIPDDLPLLDEGEFFRPTWLASVELLQPAFLSARNAVGLSVFAHRRIVPGIVVDEGFGAEASLTQRFDHNTPLSLSYRYEMSALFAGQLYFCVYYAICDEPTIETLRGRQSVSPVALSYLNNSANHPIAPTSGYRIRAQAEHASGMTLSDFSHHRLVVDASAYYPLDLHRTRVIAGRVRAGWVYPLEGSSDFAPTPAPPGAGDDEWTRILHPRKRFYAGGSRSVRGFRENQLGPRILTIDPNILTGDGGCTTASLEDASCDPNDAPADGFEPRAIGGTTVIEGSVEYRFPLWRQFQGAAFVDGALIGQSIGNLFGEGIGAVTPGIGVRMESPVGPVRIDLGFRPNRVDELSVVTEIQDDSGVRRLVRLETPRAYNPLDARSGGFLSQALARLTLHLSIGEAY